LIDFDDEIIALPTLLSTRYSEGKLFNLIYILRPENINMINVSKECELDMTIQRYHNFDINWRNRNKLH